MKSFGIGSSTTGYVHVPPLHLQEIFDLMRRISPYRWKIHDGVVNFGRDTSFTFPGHQRIAAYLWGMFWISVGIHRGSRTSFSYIPRARLPPGFYASPPSLLANSVEEAMMHRGLINTKSFFKITQVDTLFSETVNIPQGIFTPELLHEVIQSSISSDTQVILEHVDTYGTPRENWVRWSFRSGEGYPFTLDFSESTSAVLARVLGFRQRRYTGRVMYVGEAFAVPATTNLFPAPTPSVTERSTRGSIRATIRDRYRYMQGVYTITGTAPSQQRFTILTEPGQSFAIPNTGMQRDFYESMHGQGTIDITTKGIASQQSYGFRRGDVVRLTGVTQSTVPIVPIVNLNKKVTQIAARDVFEGVTSILAVNLGGMGYYDTIPPTVQILTTPDRGSVPTVNAHIHDGRIALFTISDPVDAIAEFSTAPIIRAGTTNVDHSDRNVCCQT